MTPVAQQPAILKQHRSSLYLLAACTAALGLLFLLTVAKDLRDCQTLEAQLADATRQADARELLAPLLAELKAESATPLPAPLEDDGTPLAAGDLSADRYGSIIGEIIRQCGLKQVSLMTDLESILADTESLRVNLTVRGAFPDFRHLVLALGRLPFLTGIEGFYIERSADTGLLEMFLQLRLQLATPVGSVHEHQ
jgi:hypothetical protein